MSSIKLQNVSLDYIVRTGEDSIKKLAIYALSRCFQKSSAEKKVIVHNTSYRALDHINLEIRTGDRIGILGRNGAGKSTLLRVLAKVYKPNCGYIDIQGKISTLFNVNLGMNMEATGYDNISNLAILQGVSKKDIPEIIRDVEAFTELGDFLHHPVRTYSTGMQMKLAFAVATQASSNIMLIDEVIGTGDMHFMEKATQRLEKTLEKSHILVLTTHSNET
jgi:ABC-2 type transport system ATP-binding protein/lipopolysaccharide transport system ATP-binding protein